MLKNDTIDKIIQRITLGNVQPVNTVEQEYPRRELIDAAEVLRIAPSPTGFVHIGTIYASLVNERIAHQSKGKFLLRIEDTDKKREVEGSIGRIKDALEAFGIKYDEGPDVGGDYGPYFQSKRKPIYLSYAIDLLSRGLAYPCFATSDDLKNISQKQRQEKIRPGYYGEWAMWRDRSDSEVNDKLDRDAPFVLRFRSSGNHTNRIAFDDVLKGRVEMSENDLDIPIIKSDGSRLPTYHFAHVIDDYLMGVTKVFRSDEWLSSVPLHIELSEAIGHEPFVYGHFAPISKLDKEGHKRKLSKRKDDEADVRFWLEDGYPVEAIKAYLLGLANSNFEDWYKDNLDKSVDDFPVSLKKLAMSRSPLLDMVKIEDYSKDFISRISLPEFFGNVYKFADNEFKSELDRDRDYSMSVLAIERDGNKPRKDLVKWTDAFNQYGYFFDKSFGDVFRPKQADLLNDLSDEAISVAIDSFLKTFDIDDNKDTWFKKMKDSANKSNFAVDRKEHKDNPEQYNGNLADFARVLRVRLTGKNRTPDLWTMMQVMGDERVRQRLLL